MLGLLPVTPEFGFSDARDGHLRWDSPSAQLPSGSVKCLGEFAGSTLRIHPRNLDTENMSDTVTGPHASVHCRPGPGDAWN